MIKKIIMGILTLSLMIGSVACTSSEDNDKDKLAEIKENGKIILGTAADYPPYEYHTLIDGEDTIVGFDIDIAKRIAEDIGVELEVVDMKFEGLLPALVTGDIDFIVAGMVADEDRKESIDFSIPYYEGLQRFLIRAEDKDKLKTQEDFKGLKIGAQKSTLQEDIAIEQFPDAEYVGISKITDLILELQNNKIDGIVIAEPVGDAYESQNPDLYMPELVLEKEEGISVGVNKNQEALLDQINKTLQELIDSGEIDILIEDAIKSIDD